MQRHDLAGSLAVDLDKLGLEDLLLVAAVIYELLRAQKRCGE